MTITYHPITKDFYQGSPAWFDARCGVLTSSDMDLCITPAKLEVANNNKVLQHVYELAAQRITRYVEPSYMSDDMARGHQAEEYAVMHYEANYAPVERCCFITNDKWGFTLGYSPDGLVGKNGIIEVKGPRQKGHLQTILDGKMPITHLIQVQTELMVSERQFCEFISYHGGMPMFTLRIEPDFKVQEAIIRAATAFEESVRDAVKRFGERMASGMRLIPTERVIEAEIY